MKRRELEIGQAAPAFSAPDHAGETTALEDFKGQWLVLYFYPKDDTPGCTTEACEFTSGLEGFDSLNAVVLGCSPDSPEKHRKFREKYGLKIRLLSDPDHELLSAYGAWGEKNMYGKISIGVIRSTVIIDPEGRIVHHYKRAKAKGHAEAVQKRLAALST